MTGGAQWDYLVGLLNKGGPGPEDYLDLDQWFADISAAVKRGDIHDEQIRAAWDRMHPAFSRESLQGFVCRKPRGYAGDFEILDKIYAEWVSTEPEIAQWDRYFQSRAAPRAVRNRKRYYVELLSALERTAPQEVAVLDVACGSAQGIREHFARFPKSRIRFNCVDQDPDAIAAAEVCLDGFADRVTFRCENAFKMSPPPRMFDLVCWAL